jgi:endonuclease YncB( thermonuclease family)
MLHVVNGLALALLACGLAAVEVPAEVVSVTDGDTIVVAVSGTEERIRLLYLDTPESKGNSHGEATPDGKLAAEFMDLQAKTGSAVTLWGPGENLERDRYKRILAVVITSRGDTLQERVIKAGWSPLWEKYGKADPKWRETLVAAEEKAKKDKAGAWATDPKYMTDKGNETTAKKGEK